jgi:hypothetical protein
MVVCRRDEQLASHYFEIAYLLNKINLYFINELEEMVCVNKATKNLRKKKKNNENK